MCLSVCMCVFVIVVCFLFQCVLLYFGLVCVMWSLCTFVCLYD